MTTEIGASIAEAVRRVSNREAFRFVYIDWTALGAALVQEWPAATPEPPAQHLDFCSGGEFCSLDDCLCECHITPALREGKRASYAD